MKLGMFFSVLVTPVFAEMRTYQSLDGKKSFTGELLDFNPESGKAQMRSARGKVMTFPISILSSECQEHVVQQGPVLRAQKSLSVTTKHARKQTAKNKPSPGQWHFEKHDHHYTILVRNNRESNLKDVEIEYDFYIERNRREFQGQIEKVSGSKNLDIVIANNEETIISKKVNLERWSDNPLMPIRGGGG